MAVIQLIIGCLDNIERIIKFIGGIPGASKKWDMVTSVRI